MQRYSHNPFPPFFFACSAFTLASASNCFLAILAIDHFAKLSAVTGVPTYRVTNRTEQSRTECLIFNIRRDL